MKKIILGILVIFSFVQGIFAREVVCENTTTTYKSTFVPKGGSFTLSLFINVKGYTDKKKQEWPNGMVVSCGSGYYDGWRLMLAEQNNFVPFFEIGRPEIGAIALRGDYGLSKNYIHHLAIVWEESASTASTMRIYIDGNLAGERTDVDIRPIMQGRELVVGYNDFGVGELDATMYGVEYFDHAMTGNEIKGTIYQGIATFLTNENDVAQMLYKKAASISNNKGTTKALAFLNEFRSEYFSDKLDPITIEQYLNETNFVGKFSQLPALENSIILRINQTSDETTFRNNFLSVIEKIKAMRAASDNTPVEIQFAQEIFLYNEPFVLENINNVTFSFVRFLGYEEKPIASQSSASLDSQFKKNDHRKIVKIDAPGVEALLPYNCSTPHANGFLTWKKSETQPYKMLKLASFPQSSFIDGTSDGTTINLSGELAGKISAEKFILAHGYWRYFWADAATAIQPKENGFTLKYDIPYGLGEKPRYKFLNVFSELDKLDEYCADTNSLYVVMDNNSEEQTLCYTKKTTPFFIIKNCKNISFQNTSFIGSMAPAIQVENVDGLEIKNVFFENIGSSALIMNNVKNVYIKGGHFVNIGFSGIRIWAGDRKQLKAPNVLIFKTFFNNTGYLAKTYTPSIFMEGYGIVVRECDFSNTPSSAMRIEGSGHVVEHCIFENNVLESDDQGTIDMWGDPTYRGCVFRYNTFKNIGDGTNQECGRAAIRFDDMISGMYVYGNTFINTSRGNFGAVQIHGGSHNLIFNNKFIDCNYGVSFTPRGDEIFKQKEKELENHYRDYLTNDLYLKAYPSLTRVNKDYDVNFLFGNTYINCKKIYNNKKAFNIFFQPKISNKF